MNQQSEMREIKTVYLVRDTDNPRFFHLMHRGTKNSLTQDSIEKEIIDNDDDIPLLTKSIQKSGVRDPIWVVPRDGKFVVMGGNRRTVVLKRLLKENHKAPAGVRFDVVQAHVIPS